MRQAIAPQVRLKSLVAGKIRSGIGAAGEFDNPDWPRYVRITDIAGPRQLRTDIFKSLPPDVAAQARLEKNDLLLTSVGATFGKSYFHEEADGPACYAGYLSRVAPGTDVVPAFLAYWTESSHYWHQVRREVIQATIQNFSAERFGRLRVPVLPVEMQQEVVRFLDAKTSMIDALIGRKVALSRAIDEEAVATVLGQVGGVGTAGSMRPAGLGWLSLVPAHWVVAPLYSRYEVRLGKMVDAKRIVGTALAPYLSNVNVQWDRVHTEDLPTMDFTPEERQKLRLREGDLLVCEGGEVGRAAIWRAEIPECYFQKAVHRLRPLADRDVPRYFYYVMLAAATAGHFRAGGNPNTIDHLTGDQLRHYRFPFPPKEEQEEIARTLDIELNRIRTVQGKIGEAIDRLKELRLALITAAVTGQIDVGEAA